MDGSFVMCCPKNDGCQIVFTHPRPTAAKRDYRSRGTALGQIAAIQNIENLKKLLGGIPIPGTSYSVGGSVAIRGGAGDLRFRLNTYAGPDCMRYT